MNFAARRPILTFLLLMYPLAWALAVASFVVGVPEEVGVAVATVVGSRAPPVRRGPSLASGGRVVRVRDRRDAAVHDPGLVPHRYLPPSKRWLGRHGHGVPGGPGGRRPVHEPVGRGRLGGFRAEQA